MPRRIWALLGAFGTLGVVYPPGAVFFFRPIADADSVAGPLLAQPVAFLILMVHLQIHDGDPASAEECTTSLPYRAANGTPGRKPLRENVTGEAERRPLSAIARKECLKRNSLDI